MDTDWDSIVWHTTNWERANRILKAWDEHLVDPYLPRTLGPKLQQAGFKIETQQIIPLFNPVFDTETYSNRIIDVIVAFVTRPTSSLYGLQSRERAGARERRAPTPGG